MPDLIETMNLDRLQKELQKMIEQARSTCKMSGDMSSECAAAWDAVEEMQAATADRLAQQKTDFERYCEVRPDALECRMYDV
jgi:uncharacterized protein YgiB involved in biofilm formation